jgi:hypothetical protein
MPLPDRLTNLYHRAFPYSAADAGVPGLARSGAWPKTPTEDAIAAEMAATGLDRLPAIRRIQQRQALAGRR